jgi:hypothetical protein
VQLTVKFVPVLDPKTGRTQLFDIYIDGKWHGSRSTLDMCVAMYGPAHD